jgi:UDP-N-acetylglucosamine 2-epimerase (non-hydrolysing)
VTLIEGTNVLVEPGALVDAAMRHLEGPTPPARRPQLWDGHAGERIADVLVDWLGHAPAEPPY